MARFLQLLAPFGIASAADPSSGWLSYARFDADNQAKITQMNASWVVPENPTSSGASPALWFGIQTYKGDGALIQPILKWLSNDWYIFHEIFDWTDMHDEQPNKVKVQAGDHITSGLSYRETDNSYDMWMRSANLGEDLFYNYKLESKQHAVEATAYFVLEHQPRSCGQLPSSDSITFTDVNVEVEGAKVEAPLWAALQEQPKCGSQVVVQDSHTIKIEWDHTSAFLEQPVDEVAV